MSQKYINAWENLIAQWMVLPSVSDPNNPFRPLQTHPNLSIEHLPEPYLGDPLKCSIVMINLNPGEGGYNQHWNQKGTPGNYVYEACSNGYKGFATPFPFLLPPHTASYKWWTERWAYLQKLLKMKGIQPNNLYQNPFAIELCGLHSVGTSGISFPNYLAALKTVSPDLDPTKVIDIAIQNSDAKFGFAVGKPIYNALINEGYTDITNVLGIPHHTVHNAKGALNAREFAVIEKNGSKVLCTWTSGGNSCPSAAFDSYIQNVIIPLL